MPHASRPVARAVSLAAGIAFLSATLTACTPGRSVQAYCDAVETHKARYVSAMDDASSSGSLAGLIEAGSAIGDIKSMWDDLAKVAPSEIQTDSETVRDAWDKASDKAADRNWFGAAVVALSSAAAMQRVNDYIAQHCGVDAAPVDRNRSAAPTASPSPTPSDDTTVVVSVNPGSPSLWQYGPQAIITGDVPSTSSAGGSFLTRAVVNGRIVKADRTGPTPDGGMFNSNVVYGTQQLADSPVGFVTTSTVHKLSEGLTPESFTTSVVGYDAESPTPTASAPVKGCAVEACSIDSVTLFGDVAVVGYSVHDATHLEGISLSTKQVVWRLDDEQPAAVSGALLVVHGVHEGSDDTAPTFAIDAQTGTRAWTFRDSVGKGATEVTKALDPDYALIKSPAPTSDGASVYRFNVTDLQTGRVVASRFAFERQVSAVFDPITKRFSLAGVADSISAAEDAPRLETLDATGHAIFTVPPSQFGALGNPDVLAALDGRLSIGGEHGIDEVDAATGAKEQESPQVTGSTSHPLLALIDGSVAVVHTDTGETTWISLLLSAAGTPTPAQIAAVTPSP